MIKVAGVEMPSPTSVEIGYFDLTKADRAASGKMVMELIATKRRVDVMWEMMPDADLKTLIDTITANKPFFIVEYPGAGGQKTMTCYVGDITTGLWHTIGGIRYWKEVSVPFIEQ